MSLISILCLIATLVVYACNKKLYSKYPVLLFSPAILTPSILILLVLILHIPYETYIQGGHWIVWMLGPATIAFAIPIYEYRQIISKHLLSISMGVVIGMLAGIISALYLSKLFHFDQATSFSLMARTISTPFSIELASRIGGSVELAILFTMMTGVTGILIGDLVLGALHLKSHFAMGAALGNSAHSFGTAKAYMRHQEEGVVASVTMVLAGIFMVMAGPYLIPFIVSLLG
ncbi:LrgB family protein [Acinetobacter sp. WZC-1]|uniref:LrgB family protein n=1 Tax=Acinetobacter sp. WZC-1 TaxID=3459034 RepID=UPI00403E021A